MADVIWKRSLPTNHSTDKTYFVTSQFPLGAAQRPRRLHEHTHPPKRMDIFACRRMETRSRTDILQKARLLPTHGRPGVANKKPR